MSDASAPPVELKLPRRTVAGFAVFGTLMIGLLAVQVAMIEDQRSSVDRQLATAARQADALVPLVEDAQPLVEQIAGGAPQIRRLGRDTQGLLTELTPLARDLDDARAADQLRAAGALSRMLINADVGSATRATRQLAVTLLEADVPGSLRALDGFTRRVRDARFVERGARAADVTAREIPQVPPLLRRSVSVQEQTLAILRESLAVQRENLHVAQQTKAAADRAAASAESIDRKTGGSAPPPAGITTP